MCFSYRNLAAGGNRGGETVGQHNSAVHSTDLVGHCLEGALPDAWSRTDINKVSGKAVVQTSSRFELDALPE